MITGSNGSMAGHGYGELKSLLAERGWTDNRGYYRYTKVAVGLSTVNVLIDWPIIHSHFLPKLSPVGSLRLSGNIGFGTSIRDSLKPPKVLQNNHPATFDSYLTAPGTL